MGHQSDVWLCIFDKTGTGLSLLKTGVVCQLDIMHTFAAAIVLTSSTVCCIHCFVAGVESECAALWNNSITSIEKQNSNNWKMHAHNGECCLPYMSFFLFCSRGILVF